MLCDIKILIIYLFIMELGNFVVVVFIGAVRKIGSVFYGNYYISGFYCEVWSFCEYILNVYYFKVIMVGNLKGGGKS